MFQGTASCSQSSPIQSKIHERGQVLDRTHNSCLAPQTPADRPLTTRTQKDKSSFSQALHAAGAAAFLGVAFLAAAFFGAAAFLAAGFAVVFATRPDLVLLRVVGLSTTAGA